jgi:hypothetical protein
MTLRYCLTIIKHNTPPSLPPRAYETFARVKFLCGKEKSKTIGDYLALLLN